jgi:superfamily I DNA/RNA helicase
VNYRTSHQIRERADRLLGPEITDVDGNLEERRHTVSVFNGPAPLIRIFRTESEESEAVGAWLRTLTADGVQPHEIGVFVRSSNQVPRATAAATAAGLSARVLDDRVEVRSGSVNVATMHLAKGLEFRVVSVMACDDEVLPLQSRIESVGDDGDLQEVYDTERQLLYVACTRARDQLSVSAVEPASEFLDDLKRVR